MKTIFSGRKLELVRALAEIVDTNPFTARRGELEEIILQDKFVRVDAAWSSNSDNPNQKLLREVTKATLIEFKNELQNSEKLSSDDLILYREIAMSYLFDTVADEFYDLLNQGWDGSGEVKLFDDFNEIYKQLFNVRFFPSLLKHSVDHSFAICFQTSRAFNMIYENIFGSSQSIIKLRSEIWQSIFTHRMRRYRKSSYTVMNDVTTLITGPSGTGKELVARAIAFSRYIPFSTRKKQFVEPFKSLFHPIHLSALSSTLIESELFGHSKGAFTGALTDRIGRLEACSQYGTVFLDEIGEVSEPIQVKMLRVLQERSYQKLGENLDRTFKGKIIAATNRDIQTEIEKGNFRSDFYYRLCSDLIRTPSLREQTEDITQIKHLVLFLAKRVVGLENAKVLARETMKVIEKNLGLDYEWPGNVRELEQCIRNVFIRGDYQPFERQVDWLGKIKKGVLTADQLLNLYCKHIYDKTGSYASAAAVTGLDRRTVKTRLGK